MEIYFIWEMPLYRGNPFSCLETDGRDFVYDGIIITLINLYM